MAIKRIIGKFAGLVIPIFKRNQAPLVIIAVDNLQIAGHGQFGAKSTNVVFILNRLVDAQIGIAIKIKLRQAIELVIAVLSDALIGCAVVLSHVQSIARQVISEVDQIGIGRIVVVDLEQTPKAIKITHNIITAATID